MIDRFPGKNHNIYREITLFTSLKIISKKYKNKIQRIDGVRIQDINTFEVEIVNELMRDFNLLKQKSTKPTK